MDITIVTCLYDIRAKEAKDNETETRSISNYFELGRHMLRVRLPMIIYTDNQEVVDEVENQRKQNGLSDITTVVWLPFENTYFYKDMTALQERMNEHELHNWNRKKDTPLYVTLNNNKFDFLQRSMDNNPYSSTFFLWMDYGIQHCAKASPEEWEAVWTEWPEFIRKETEKIHHLRIHTVVKPEGLPWKEYFRMIYHHIAGSMFGGHEKAVREYIELFKTEWNTILYEEKWWQLDEAVMTLVVEKYPEKFRLFYGDYDGLITNFIHSKRSWELIFQTAQRHLDGRKYTESEHVLSTFDPVMKEKIGDCSFRRYLTQRICNDFYRWNGSFSKALCDLLLTDKLNEIPHSLLQGHIHNIRYYNDKPSMKFLARWAFHDHRNSEPLRRWKEFYRGGEQWIPIGNRCLSALALDSNNMRQKSLPLDYLDVLPDQVLKLFRKQFADFYSARTISNDYINPYGVWFEHFQKHEHSQNEEMFERRVRRLYEFLETPKKRTIFLHTTELFLMRPFTEEENVAYDKKLIEICKFIERNFPELDFMFVCLYTNRSFTVSDNIPSKMIIIMVETPYEYGKALVKDMPIPFIYSYREGIYEWLRMMVM